MINMQQLMQQAQAMQKKLQTDQEKMKNTTFTGDAGNGAVKISLNGVYEMTKIEINPSILDDKEMLEDMLKIALNEALLSPSTCALISSSISACSKLLG